jgi:hypothetical protein
MKETKEDKNQEIKMKESDTKKDVIHERKKNKKK